MNRKVEKLQEGVWNEVEFKDLTMGDTFRLTDMVEDGFEDGTKSYLAETDAYINKDGIFEIKAGSVA